MQDSKILNIPKNSFDKDDQFKDYDQKVYNDQ